MTIKRNAIIMKRFPLVKVAAVAAILALGGAGVAHDALAWGRFDGRHFGEGGRVTIDDQGRRVFYDQKGRRITKPATVCRCTELDCCDR